MKHRIKIVDKDTSVKVTGSIDDLVVIFADLLNAGHRLFKEHGMRRVVKYPVTIESLIRNLRQAELNMLDTSESHSNRHFYLIKE